MNDYTKFKGKITFKDNVDPYDVGMALAIQHAITGITNIECPPEYRDFTIEFSGEIHHKLAQSSWDAFLQEHIPHIKEGFIFYHMKPGVVNRSIFDSINQKWVTQTGRITYVGDYGTVDSWTEVQSEA